MPGDQAEPLSILYENSVYIDVDTEQSTQYFAQDELKDHLKGHEVITLDVTAKEWGDIMRSRWNGEPFHKSTLEIVADILGKLASIVTRLKGAADSLERDKKYVEKFHFIPPGHAWSIASELWYSLSQTVNQIEDQGVFPVEAVMKVRLRFSDRDVAVYVRIRKIPPAP